MQNVEYTESIVSTTNTKLTATLMVFGCRLRHKLPLEWNDEFIDKESYLKFLENPKAKDRQPKTKVQFNLEQTSHIKRMIEVFSSETPAAETQIMFEDALSEFLKERGVSIATPEFEKLKELFSIVLIQACREALENREFLVKLIMSMPETAKWDCIKGEGKTFVKIGKHSSNALRAEFLAKI